MVFCHIITHISAQKASISPPQARGDMGFLWADTVMIWQKPCKTLLVSDFDTVWHIYKHFYRLYNCQVVKWFNLTIHSFVNSLHTILVKQF